MFNLNNVRRAMEARSCDGAMGACQARDLGPSLHWLAVYRGWPVETCTRVSVADQFGESALLEQNLPQKISLAMAHEPVSHQLRDE